MMYIDKVNVRTVRANIYAREGRNLFNEPYNADTKLSPWMYYSSLIFSTPNLIATYYATKGLQYTFYYIYTALISVLKVR